MCNAQFSNSQLLCLPSLWHNGAGRTFTVVVLKGRHKNIGETQQQCCEQFGGRTISFADHFAQRNSKVPTSNQLGHDFLERAVLFSKCLFLALWAPRAVAECRLVALYKGIKVDISTGGVSKTRQLTWKLSGWTKSITGKGNKILYLMFTCLCCHLSAGNYSSLRMYSSVIWARSGFARLLSSSLQQ